MRWKLRDYVTLRDGQTAEFDQRLIRFHDGHRREELPRYAELARGAAERIGRGLKIEDAKWLTDATQIRFRTLLSRAIEDTAPMMTTLDAAQIDEIVAGFAKAGRKLDEERLSGDPEKRIRRRIERRQSNYERWLGDLSPLQAARVAEAVRAMPDLSAFQSAERKRNVNAFLSMLRERLPAGEIVERLHGLIVDPDALRDPQYKSTKAVADAVNERLMLELDRLMTAKQRDEAVRRLTSYAKDFEALAGRQRPL